MVWGCFIHDNVGPNHCMEGIMGQRVYLDIIKSVMLPHAKDKMTRKCILKQVNDPNHYARLLRIILNHKKSKFLNGPHRA